MENVQQQLRKLKSLQGPFPILSSKELQELPSDPETLFLNWLVKAIDMQVTEPHAMTLSTVDSNGFPDARMLILKNISNNKWYFATSSESKKGQQLENNPHVALTFYWASLGKQIRIRGKALDMGDEPSRKDFLERSEEARAIALLEKQSKEITKNEDIDKKLQNNREQIKQNPTIVTPNWRLYAVEAHEVEFWQGKESRQHTRIKYKLVQKKWQQTMLWP